MRTFDQFVSQSAGACGGVNLIFEAGMYSLVNDLEQIVKALRDARVQFEVVGGAAVNAHILSSNRSRSFVTRDIDLLLNRSDLERAAKAGETLGYEAKKMMGGYALVRPGQDLGEAVHLLFAGEKSKSTQPFPHPDLDPEEKELFAIRIPVAPLRDLLHMKLTSLRPKDIIHIETLDEVGLITAGVERQLQPALQERLKEAREVIAANKPDIEG